MILPDTFKDDIHVVALLQVVFPDINKDDWNVEELLKLINVGGFDIAL